MPARIALVAALALLATSIPAFGAVTMPATPARSASIPPSLALAIPAKDLEAASDIAGGGWHNPYVIGITVLLAVIILVLVSGGATKIVDKKQ